MLGSKGDSDIENRLLDSVGEGKGGMIRENNIDTYTLTDSNPNNPSQTLKESSQTSQS